MRKLNELKRLPSAMTKGKHIFCWLYLVKVGGIAVLKIDGASHSTPLIGDASPVGVPGGPLWGGWDGRWPLDGKVSFKDSQTCLSKLQNVFFPIAKGICPNCQIYLSTLQNSVPSKRVRTKDGWWHLDGKVSFKAFPCTVHGFQSNCLARVTVS